MNNKTIIIGNGINCAFNTLIDTNILDKNPLAKRRFSYDEIIKEMFQAGDPRRSYNDVEKLLLECGDNRERTEVIKLFIDVLSKMHLGLSEDLSTVLDDNKKTIFKNNIHNFNKIYTTNFDLKLYYLFIRLQLFNDIKHNYKDSFSTPYNSISNNYSYREYTEAYNTATNYFYLHGAIHLLQFCNKKNPCKIANVINNNICHHTNNLLADKDYDIKRVIVIGSTSDVKTKIITENNYLSIAHSTLKELTGDVVIYGCSMDDNDKHIWNSLNSSNIDSIYIGICPTQKDKVGEVKRKYFENKSTYFYRQENYNIWTLNDWLKEITNKSNLVGL